MSSSRLNYKENLEYREIMHCVLLSFSPGKYFASDFFCRNSTDARITKKLYSDVKAGLIPNISLVGERSRDGYLIKHEINPSQIESILNTIINEIN